MRYIAATEYMDERRKKRAEALRDFSFPLSGVKEAMRRIVD